MVTTAVGHTGTRPLTRMLPLVTLSLLALLVLLASPPTLALASTPPTGEVVVAPAAEKGHRADCPTARVLARQSPAATVLRFEQQHIAIDPLTSAETALALEKFDFACDGKNWCLRLGPMCQMGAGEEVAQWEVGRRMLMLLPRGSTPHPESVMFALTQAQEFNIVIPPAVFLAACACGGEAKAPAPAAAPAPAPAPAPAAAIRATASEHGWEHSIECAQGADHFVSKWELIIPPPAAEGADAKKRRVRVEVTEWDAAGLPTKIVRTVERWKDGKLDSVLGRTVLTVTERRAFDPKADAHRVTSLKLADGWSVFESKRQLQYVYGGTEFSVAGTDYTAKEPIRVHPSEIKLDELIPAAPTK